MTSYDFHHEKTAVQKMERKKIFAFWERFANDRHRPTFGLHQKSAKKPEKLGKCRSMYLISILYAREKKVKNFFYIERFANDLHRPTSFFSWRGGKKILQIENGRWYVDTTHAQPYPSKNFRFLGKVCKRPTSTHIRPTSKKCKKARKTGRWRSVHLIYILYACEKKSKIFLYIEGMEMTFTDLHLFLFSSL